ncbi:aldo/keto reductase [Micromonospora sp. WMMD714]|uniref:aldo/keto reductase n=1 Tax=Micromonospora sp. WMMD714 TaxID=3016097 RepID=UPI00249A6E51|nr:aldo/keto reductase [Micromonospora sp. WMMD714]WFE65040.1 aldo/keto reductase [Micromonospora sp. WMMD714]
MAGNRGVARLVLGTMNYGTTVDRQRAFALLDRFVEAGGEWIDTANCYAFWSDPTGLGGASERVIGAWLRARPGGRTRVKIATKVRYDPLVAHRWPESAEGLSAGAVTAGVAGSLSRLGVDAVDLLWAHGEDRGVPLAETVTAFGGLVGTGHAHRVGAANHASWRVEQARALARDRGVAPWSALQLRHSLAQPRPGALLPDRGHKLLTADDLDYAHTEGLDLWAYTPLINGGYVRPDKPFPEAYDHPGTTRVLGVLDELTAETGATRNQVVLAWLLRQGIRPIVGVSDLAQLDEAVGAVDVPLDDGQLARLADAR